jgi:TetR/AcrR family transcriptional repressor of nem operon
MAHRKSAGAKSERTRRRIVSAAAAAYREQGISGVGVRDIMKRAGLTQGGFYFHFPDKDALFPEAAWDASAGLATMLLERAEAAPPGKRLQAIIDTYLSREHRDHPGSGCMMAALGSEVARNDRKARASFCERANIMLERIAGYFPGATSVERRQNAAVLMPSMAGVLIASRVLTDPAASDLLLERAREFFAASFPDT